MWKLKMLYFYVTFKMSTVSRLSVPKQHGIVLMSVSYMSESLIYLDLNFKHLQ